MPNLTPLFFELVGPTAPKRTLPKHAFDKEAETANNLISELQAFLVSVRTSYLSVRTLKEGRNESELARALRYGARGESVDPADSGSKTTYMTDKQRDEVDYETRSALQNLTRKIRALEKWTEDEKRKKNEQKGGFLSSLMKDELREGVEKTQEQHRDAVLWFLNDRLRAVSEMQQLMQEQRLARERERVMSRNNMVGSRGVGKQEVSESNAALEKGASEEKTPFDSSISPEMIQQLESEHAELLDSLQGKLGKVHEAEKSLYEISEMQNELTMHLASQSEKIQSLINDANQTSIDVGDANKNLESAKSRNRRASRMIIGISLFLAFLLLFYDYMVW